ncbi:hypothetical protein Bhyg_17986 [Pseudolycoriella hygida]|uniref:Interferon gamma n=1 Tax=Pseudolycoriella hygida TaxID=35572 RepID=A0A9Q0RU23_9DIPT|nr:hypothetical protein Bhyg_17986 [Pseudolycoriella hygida]
MNVKLIFCFAVLTLSLNYPIFCNVIRGSNVEPDDTVIRNLQGQIKSDFLAFVDMWEDFSELPDFETRKERYSLLANSFQKLNQLIQKLDEGKFRIRQQEERRKWERDEMKRREFENDEQLNEKQWYHHLFSITLPGQLYSIFSYFKSDR